MVQGGLGAQARPGDHLIVQSGDIAAAGVLACRAARAQACAAAGVTLLALALRFAMFGRAPRNRYHDAAARSVGLSWHNLFYGAFEPCAQVSIDKAPIDLWLQVLSVKLLASARSRCGARRRRRERAPSCCRTTSCGRLSGRGAALPTSAGVSAFDPAGRRACSRPRDAGSGAVRRGAPQRSLDGRRCGHVAQIVRIPLDEALDARAPASRSTSP
jgi:hypothetical protein